MATLVTSLRDVEQQLWQADMAVKLHLKRLQDPRYRDDGTERTEIETLVASIERAQSELQITTTEILTFAKSKTVTEPLSDGEETETEDEFEDAFLFDDDHNNSDGEMNEAAVTVETFCRASGIENETHTTAILPENKFKEEMLEQSAGGQVGIFVPEIGQPQQVLILLDDEEDDQDICDADEHDNIAQNSEATHFGSTENEAAEGQDASIATDQISSVFGVERQCISNDQPGTAVLTGTDNMAPAIATGENKKSCIDNELRLRLNEVKNEACRAVKDFRLALRSGTCSQERAKAFSVVIKRMTSVIMDHDAEYNSRRWIERFVEALDSILKNMSTEALVQEHAVVQQSCLNLEQYCAVEYPDYLPGMLNNVQWIEWFEQNNKFASTRCQNTLQRLVDELRRDCVDYTNKQTAIKAIPRTEEQWDRFTIVCERLATWIKLAKPAIVRKFLQVSLVLREFDERFPGRIPEQLLANIPRNEIPVCSNLKQVHGVATELLEKADEEIETAKEDTQQQQQRSGCEQVVTIVNDVAQQASLEVCQTGEGGDNQVSGESETMHTAANSRCNEKQLDSGNLKPQEDRQRHSTADTQETDAALKGIPVEVTAATSDDKELRLRIIGMKRKACDAINNFRRSIQSGNCPRQKAITFSDAIARMTSVITRHEAKYNSRLWLERLVGALYAILKRTSTSNLHQLLTLVRKSCLQLQQYCAANFPDYLLDMLNDVKIIQTLEESNESDSAKFQNILQRLVEKLQLDCMEYAKTQALPDATPRNEEQWHHLITICGSLAKSIKLANPTTVKKVSQALPILRGFTSKFPNRILDQLLLEMDNLTQTPSIQGVQSHQEKRIENTSNGLDGASCGKNSSSTLCALDPICGKKRSRDAENDRLPTKRTRQSLELNQVGLVLIKYSDDAKKAGHVIMERTPTRDNALVDEVLSDLEKTATAANSIVYRFLSNGQGFDKDGVMAARFRYGTVAIAQCLYQLSPHKIKHSWLKQFVNDLRSIFSISISTTLAQEARRLTISLKLIEAFLDGKYVCEDVDAPSLGQLEDRIRQFQQDPLRLSNPKMVHAPIQSISDCLMKNFDMYISKCLVRSPENWMRFREVGNTLAVWMATFAVTKSLPGPKLWCHLLKKFTAFSEKYPGKLPAKLLAITKELAERQESMRLRAQARGQASQRNQRKEVEIHSYADGEYCSY